MAIVQPVAPARFTDGLLGMFQPIHVHTVLAATRAFWRPNVRLDTPGQNFPLLAFATAAHVGNVTHDCGKVTRRTRHTI